MAELNDNRPVKVEVKDLTKRFGDLLVLDHMNFDIKKNEFVCVVGPTGCGKTTFLNCLTRIHQPSEGDLFIDGEPADPRKHNISFIFQEPSALPWLTVEENIAYALYEKHGHLDILVNCAGVALPVPTFKLTEEQIDMVIEINMKAPLYCCQAIGKYMRKQGEGSIVNISSGNSRMINVGRTPYGITKGAINLMTMQLGAEWAMYGIKVNAIAPGWIETEMVKRPLRSGILDAKKILSVSPIGRFGKVEEIASLATFLASKESDYIVGQVIFADGGWSMGIMPDGLDFVRENDKEED